LDGIRVSISWKIKSHIFSLIEILGLESLLYFIQKYITRSSYIEINKIDENWLIHQRNLKKFNVETILEFGAGKSLAQNIYFSKYIKKQIVVDIINMLDIGLFNDAADQVSKLDSEIKKNKCKTKSDIEKIYGITYIAPFNFETDYFEPNSVDCCISTNTLEHIPLNEIYIIFKKLLSIVRNRGTISMVIDYIDHYSYFDNSISELNFLRYSKIEFIKYNHRNHYQNQLRHYDFINIFKSLGYEILISKFEDIREIPRIISVDFDINEPSLGASKGIFLLKVVK
jgi:predicted SAM-dependent methyltransferase